MADFNGIKKGNTIYDTKDATARSRISTIEGKIPSSASTSNKLATQADLPADVGLSVENGMICVTYEES